MYYLISILLRKPEIILEADPLHDILALWRAHGVPSAMILEQVSIQNMFHYAASAMSQRPLVKEDAKEQERAMAVLFDAPSAPTEEAKSDETHRMLLTIMPGDSAQIETLLDKTEAVIREQIGDNANLLFVFPLAHVRGFPGLPNN
jgi:hypothetical protein